MIFTEISDIEIFFFPYIGIGISPPKIPYLSNSKNKIKEDPRAKDRERIGNSSAPYSAAQIQCSNISAK